MPLAISKDGQTRLHLSDHACIFDALEAAHIAMDLPAEEPPRHSTRGGSPAAVLASTLLSQHGYPAAFSARALAEQP